MNNDLKNMSIKKKAFVLHAPYVYEDGTYIELLKTLLKHPQDDINIIKNAAKELSKYINFCMDASVSYYSPLKDEYIHINIDKLELNYDKFRIDLYDGSGRIIHIYSDTTEYSGINYPEIEQFIKMYKEENRIRNVEDLNEEDKERVSKYGRGYKYLLSKLLDGHSYNL